MIHFPINAQGNWCWQWKLGCYLCFPQNVLLNKSCFGKCPISAFLWVLVGLVWIFTLQLHWCINCVSTSSLDHVHLFQALRWCIGCIFAHSKSWIQGPTLQVWADSQQLGHFFVVLLGWNFFDESDFCSNVGLSHCRMMQFSLRHPGLENVICWIFEALGYKTLNPCHVLRIYHNHCGARLQKASRVNQVHSCYPKPTDQLL